MIIRLPTVDDALVIAQLSGELGYPTNAEVMAKRLSGLLLRDDHHLRVAEIDGHIAGWIQTHVSASLESGCRAEIVGLVVAARFRRNGVGRALLNDAIKWSTVRGVDALVVRSNVVREESHQFYPSMGFTSTKTQVAYQRQLEG